MKCRFGELHFVISVSLDYDINMNYFWYILLIFFFFGVENLKVCLLDWFQVQFSMWHSGKATCQCRRPKRCEFDPWIRKIPWSRKWQPTPVFLPGRFHGQRSLDHGVAKSQKWLSTDIHTHTHTNSQTKRGPSQKVRAASKYGVVSFYRLGDFIG